MARWNVNTWERWNVVGAGRGEAVAEQSLKETEGYDAGQVRAVPWQEQPRVPHRFPSAGSAGGTGRHGWQARIK